ncbi:hypothetical protein WJX82_011552 [Trebouxia sp. C0006]
MSGQEAGTSGGLEASSSAPQVVPQEATACPQDDQGIIASLRREINNQEQKHHRQMETVQEQHRRYYALMSEATVEMNIMRINFEATEVGLARARTPVGLRTAVLSDIAKLMEGTALGCGDRASKLRRLLLTWHKDKNRQGLRIVCKSVSQILTDERKQARQ